MTEYSFPKMRTMSYLFGFVLNRQSQLPSSAANNDARVKVLLLNKEYFVTEKHNSTATKSHWFGLDFRFIFGKEYLVAKFCTSNRHLFFSEKSFSSFEYLYWSEESLKLGMSSLQIIDLLKVVFYALWARLILKRYKFQHFVTYQLYFSVFYFSKYFH